MMIVWRISPLRVLLATRTRPLDIGVMRSDGVGSSCLTILSSGVGPKRITSGRRSIETQTWECSLGIRTNRNDSPIGSPAIIGFRESRW